MHIERQILYWSSDVKSKESAEGTWYPPEDERVHKLGNIETVVIFVIHQQWYISQDLCNMGVSHLCGEIQSEIANSDFQNFRCSSYGASGLILKIWSFIDRSLNYVNYRVYYKIVF